MIAHEELSKSGSGFRAGSQAPEPHDAPLYRAGGVSDYDDFFHGGNVGQRAAGSNDQKTW